MNSTCDSASTKSKTAHVVSDILVAAFYSDLRCTDDLWVKSLLSFGFALTVNALSLMKGLLKTSLTLVFPRPIDGWGISNMFRKCCSFILR